MLNEDEVGLLPTLSQSRHERMHEQFNSFMEEEDHWQDVRDLREHAVAVIKQQQSWKKALKMLSNSLLFLLKQHFDLTLSLFSFGIFDCFWWLSYRFICKRKQLLEKESQQGNVVGIRLNLLCDFINPSSCEIN